MDTESRIAEKTITLEIRLPNGNVDIIDGHGIVYLIPEYVDEGEHVGAYTKIGVYGIVDIEETIVYVKDLLRKCEEVASEKRH